MENNRVGAYVLGIGKGEDGELYVLTSTSSAPMGDTGKVWKIVPATESVEAAPEATMESGAEATQPAQGEAPPAEPPAPEATDAP
jgi:hypothetical protein